MPLVRCFFLVAATGCGLFAGANVRWEARATRGNTTHITDLGPAPLWRPPADPDGPTPHPRLDSAFTHLLLLLWPVCGAGGGAYRLLRRTRRDVVLHLAFGVGVGLSAAVVVCVGLWMLFGGWSPPLAEPLGLLGLFGGAAGGLFTFDGREARPLEM